MTRATSLLAVLAALAGCAAPPSSAPVGVLPGGWAAPVEPGEAAPGQWWARFARAELAALVNAASRDSHDLEAARARVRQALAYREIAHGARGPALDAGLSYSRQHRLAGSAETEGRTLGLSLDARYALDPWGRYRALERAATAQWSAARFARDDLRLALVSEVAAGWLEVGGLRERIAIARLNLRNAEQVLASIASRWRAGATGDLELAQQHALVAEQRRQLAALAQGEDSARARLAVLLGRPVAELRLATPGLEGLDAPALSPGAPVTLLSRRPDLAEAEARLAAAHADIAAARAALLPRVTLGASLGAFGERPGDLLNGPFRRLGAELLAPIFHAGRLRAEVRLSEARQAEVLADYRGALMRALGEVEASLAALAGLQAQLEAQREAVEAARRAFELADRRYRAGAQSLLELLDAQRTLYQAQDLLSQLRLQRLLASVALYRALGGGWQAEVAAAAN